MNKRNKQAANSAWPAKSIKTKARLALRRDVMSAAFLVLLMIAWTILRYEPTTAPADADIMVYASSSCSCYRPWIRELRSAGLAVSVVLAQDVAATQARLGVPREFSGCHTGSAAGYWIEGHVPAASIRALLDNEPGGVGGVAHLRAPIRSNDKLLWEVVTYDESGHPDVAAPRVETSKTENTDAVHR